MRDRSQSNSPNPAKSESSFNPRVKRECVSLSHRFAGLVESVQWPTLATQIGLAIGAIADPRFTTGSSWHKIALNGVLACVTKLRGAQAFCVILRENRIEARAFAQTCFGIANGAISCALRIAFTWPPDGKCTAVSWKNKPIYYNPFSIFGRQKCIFRLACDAKKGTPSFPKKLGTWMS